MEEYFLGEKICVLMGCKLEGNEMSLGECLIKLPLISQGHNQAKKLIKEHGFKKEDIFCGDCFWK